MIKADLPVHALAAIGLQTGDQMKVAVLDALETGAVFSLAYEAIATIVCSIARPFKPF